MAPLTFTEEEIEEIRQLFVSGVDEIEYRGRKIKYVDVESRLKIVQLARGAGKPYRRQAQLSRGLK